MGAFKWGLMATPSQFVQLCTFVAFWPMLKKGIFAAQ